jgi:hypothetical protein
LAKVVFDSKVGRKRGLLVKFDAKYVPLITWYVRRAATVAELLAAALPPGLARKASNAALLGARMVILEACPKAETRSG